MSICWQRCNLHDKITKWLKELHVFQSKDAQISRMQYFSYSKWHSIIQVSMWFYMENITTCLWFQVTLDANIPSYCINIPLKKRYIFLQHWEFHLNQDITFIWSFNIKEKSIIDMAHLYIDVSLLKLTMYGLFV